MAGDDFLDGGAGADTRTGGSGDDSYRIDDVRDIVEEFAGGGHDTVHATVSHALAAHVLEGNNTIALGDGIRKNDLAYWTTGSGNVQVLHLRVGEKGKPSREQGMDIDLGPNGESAISAFILADGNQLTLDDIRFKPPKAGKSRSLGAEDIGQSVHDTAPVSEWSGAPVEDDSRVQITPEALMAAAGFGGGFAETPKGRQRDDRLGEDERSHQSGSSYQARWHTTNALLDAHLDGDGDDGDTPGAGITTPFGDDARLRLLGTTPGSFVFNPEEQDRLPGFHGLGR